jgi:putative intracellular protease/amidase
MPSLLLVLTGVDHWTLDDGTHQPTGFWAEELTEPMRVFRDAGVDVTIATPGGVRDEVGHASSSNQARTPSGCSIPSEPLHAELRERRALGPGA